MELPPRVKTQHPNRENIVHDANVPVPIETAFFLEDSQRDPSKFNRFYFNFPGDWSTSNKGETIVGVRSMWLVSKRRKLEFTISIAKYLKVSFDKIPGFSIHDRIKSMTSSLYQDDLKIKEIKVIDWLSTERDFRGFFEAVHNALKSYISIWWNSITNAFEQSDIDVLNRDIQTDGYYDEKGFHEKIYSERNNNSLDKYGCAFKITEMNKDFEEVFNIGDGPTQNRKGKYNLYENELIFDNIWDRHSCKVYSSLGEQSLHNYIGNSQIYYNPIKYFKLNSSDQRFWIELYSARQYNAPVKLPNGETFVMEMQFLPYNKMLYV